MSRMASPGSALPGGYILGALSHADRIGLVYEAFPAEGRGAKARALVLHPLHLDDLREWFEGAAVLGRSLSHPNLIDVHAVGYTVNDLPVLVSEWTDGRTLRSRIAGGEVIPAAEVARVIDQVASALDYLHARNPAVIHRVVMPETVLVQPSPLPVKVLAVGHADRPQHPASKPNYLSPEELEGRRDLTPAADVFSVASLAFEALTGRAAFPGNGAAAILAAVQRGLFLDAWLEPWPEDQAAKALRYLGSAQSPISVQRPLRLEEIGAPDALGRSTQAWAGAAPWSGASHGLSPQDLLVLGRSLYGHAPRAHQLLLPAHRFDHGEGISPALAPRLGEARGLIAGWIAAAWALPDAGHA